jgi:hypothetical protein
LTLWPLNEGGDSRTWGLCQPLCPGGATVCVVRYEINGQDLVTFRLRHNHLALVGICIS